MAIDQVQYRVGRIVIDVSIDDLIVLLALKHRGQRHYRQGKAAVPWSRRARIEKNDHCVFTRAMYMRNSDGCRFFFKRAITGRKLHRMP